MTELPLWAALIAGLLLIIAGLVTLIGSVGLLRLGSFRERMHAPTMGMTLGTFGVVLASSIVASVLGHRSVVHDWLICIFLVMTAPVTAILLMQSALRRQRRD